MAQDSLISVRQFVQEDVAELLRLMKELAQLEGYMEEFAVTAADISARGLGHDPQFYALVAEVPGIEGPVGMAVCYTVPYTYTLKPDLILKELVVDKSTRGRGIGARLFLECQQLAFTLGCNQMLWKVLNGNSRAEKFYRRMGGSQDRKWEGWQRQLRSKSLDESI